MPIRPHHHLRVLVALATLGLASFGFATSASARTTPKSTASGHSTAPKPTVVLVHGAFADSSGWYGVIDQLHRDGYPVRAAPDRCWDCSSTPVDDQRGTRRAPARRGASRRSPTLRAAPATARTRGRDGREGVPLIVIQRQLGHSNLGITSVYLQGIDNAEIIETVHARRAPMIPVSARPRS